MLGQNKPGNNNLYKQQQIIFKDEIKLKARFDVRKKLSIGNKNPNYSGYTDKQIIEEAVKYFNINSKFI